MLGIRNKMTFPRLTWVGEGPITKGDIDSHRGIYQLDWDSFEGELQKRHERWRSQHQPDRSIPYRSVLPAEYDQLLRDARFAVNQTYEMEIQRNCRRALVEWNVYRGFDTNVRETCLDPGIAHVWTAFYLLNDCLYDAEARYYHRGPESWFLHYAMTYKFWGHQTGRGLVWGHAKMDELQDRMGDKHGHIGDTIAVPVRAFIQAVEDHYRDEEKTSGNES